MKRKIDFGETIKQCVFSKVFWVLYIFLIGIMWRIKSGEFVFVASDREVVITAIALVGMPLLIGLICNGYSCEIVDEYLKLKTFGFDGQVPLQGSTMSVVENPENYLRYRTYGISVCDFKFGHYRTRERTKVIVFCTTNKGPGILLKSGDAYFYIRVEAGGQIKEKNQWYN